MLFDLGSVSWIDVGTESVSVVEDGRNVDSQNVTVRGC